MLAETGSPSGVSPSLRGSLKSSIASDEVKDKMFELELSWVSKDTQGKHQRVPKEVLEEAEKFAKAAMEDDSDSDDEDMS